MTFSVVKKLLQVTGLVFILAFFVALAVFISSDGSYRFSVRGTKSHDVTEHDLASLDYPFVLVASSYHNLPDNHVHPLFAVDDQQIRAGWEPLPEDKKPYLRFVYETGHSPKKVTVTTKSKVVGIRFVCRSKIKERWLDVASDVPTEIQGCEDSTQLEIQVPPNTYILELEILGV